MYIRHGITDQRGIPLKTKKINAELLPDHKNPQPKMKITGTNRKHQLRQVNKEEYTQMVKDKQNRDLENINVMVKMSMNVTDQQLEKDMHLQQTYQELVKNK